MIVATVTKSLDDRSTHAALVSLVNSTIRTVDATVGRWCLFIQGALHMSRAGEQMREYHTKHPESHSAAGSTVTASTNYRYTESQKPMHAEAELSFLTMTEHGQHSFGDTCHSLIAAHGLPVS